MSNFNLNIKATNMDLTADLRNHIEQKISHIEKFFKLNPDELIIVEFEVEKITGEHHKNGQIFRSEINLTHKGTLLRTESTQEDILSAIEESCDEMVRRVRKNKERKIHLIRRGGNAIKKFLKFGRE
ncbi:MAG TPA: ribosome-associated translation inhibitor RaiA [Candidatus Paceibacterota bacterium]|nr:ribosome-associated translation inhibitor RaiA [Candidatus Paceibacterota bacterium]HMP18872.1 ribosome-associated translation inhibitor RaiA [Candidatus Paceibacterota bacterium]HMP85164.1 ribosome-associated translation inhibitor RaiA [Candidatus Paceibacterota bacterium]